MTLTTQDLIQIGDLLDQKLESKLETKLEPVHENIAGLESKMETLDYKLDTKLESVHERIVGMESKLDAVSEGVDRLDEGLTQLSLEVSDMKINQEALIHQVNRIDTGTV